MIAAFTGRDRISRGRGATVLFNSFEFLAFFVVVTTAYFALPHRARWLLLLGASCVFYMFFIPIYILILFATILIDWIAGIRIEDAGDPRRKKLWVAVSAVSVCAILFVFKYFNFFNENAETIAKAIGWNYPVSAFRIILPIGLSFHTFQSLAYVIEVYRGRQRAERHLGIYALYVMYFPQLVAGPIERPQNLLPQLRARHRFAWERVRGGLSLALWGLFKKVVVADTLALYVDTIYDSHVHHNGSSLLLATYFFAFQIYCDFSGYSDIARGVSRIYGVELMKNFETPYFASSISEFWSRWHISLSTWFRDYLYIPLGGNRVSLPRNLFNLFFVFFVSGLWHGANWTFVVWGALHGGYLIVERTSALIAAKRAPTDTSRRTLAGGGIRLVLTFHLVLVSWVFFRADRLNTAVDILRKIVFERGPLFRDAAVTKGAIVLALLIAADVFNRRTRYWDDLARFPLTLRWAYALVLLGCVVLLGVEGGTQFIYFQF